MKRSGYFTLLALGLVLTFAVTGCNPRPQNDKRIFGRPGERIRDIHAPPIGGPTFPNATNDIVGIPLNPRDRTNWTRNADVLAQHTVLFDYDSSVIRNNERSKVSAVADHLRGNAAVAVEVQGHCDERGTEEYNRSLGERRALALREELVRLGIDANRVDTISFGEDRPADPGHNEAAWRKNRRGEFIVLTPPQ